MIELEGEQGKTAKANKEWNSLDDKVRKEMESQYKLELEKYKEDFQIWKRKYKIDDDDLDEIKKIEKKSKSLKKVEKSKGSKGAKDTKK